MKKFTLSVLALCLIATSAFSGGYQVRLQGHRQTAMGLVGASLFGDASNIFYNPGGLSKMNSKYSFLVGGSGIFNNTAFSLENSVYKAKTDNPMGTPLFIYGAGKINDRFSVGLGVYTPYGSSAKWGDNWAGKNLIQDISMKVFFIQPTLSYKFCDRLSIGAGFVVATGTVELNKAVSYNSATIEGQAHLKGSTTNYGFNAGILVTPNEKWSIGLDYRSEVTMALSEGDATFTLPTSIETVIPKNNKFDADLPLPANLDLGASYKFSDKFLLSAEINYVFWDTYDSLKFTFKEKPELLNSNNPRLYENKMIYRIGGEYVVNDMFTLRAGFYYDPTPTNKDYFNPETPSLNTYGMSCGLTIRPTEKFAIDLSYLHLETQKDTRSYSPEYFTGTYKTRTMIPGIGLSYNF
jgi:long-chain fatty acid transport protein